MDEAARSEHRARIERDGFSIVEGAIEPELIEELSAELERIERELAIRPSGNDFEGTRTLRVYNLLRHGECFERVPVHAEVLPLVEAVLDPGCLISSLSSTAIGPGETAQLIHADDQLIPLDKPHAAVVCNTMWALSDFSEANGATRLVPGSHRADHSPEYGRAYESVPAEMSRGSVLVWHGSLWHGGGANRSSARRVGIAMNYCAGYIRQQENQQLGLPRERVKRFAPRLQQLVGYGVYNQLIGHIEKHSPAELLDGEGDHRMIWDR